MLMDICYASRFDISCMNLIQVKRGHQAVMISQEPQTRIQFFIWNIFYLINHSVPCKLTHTTTTPSTGNISVSFQQDNVHPPSKATLLGSARSTRLQAPDSFPLLFLPLFLIMKIKEPIIPMTAVTAFRLNHKVCSKCWVCSKPCSLTYGSHYGVNLQKTQAGFSCRCRAKSHEFPATCSAPAAQHWEL